MAAPTNGPTQNIHCTEAQPINTSFKEDINIEREREREKEGEGDTHMVIPRFFPIQDNSRAEASCRVDACAGDGDGGQVNHKHSKPNWEWSQYLLYYNYYYLKQNENH